MIKSKRTPDAVVLNYSIDKDAHGYILCANFADCCSTTFGKIERRWSEDAARLKTNLDYSLALAKRLVKNSQIIVPPAWMLERRPEFRKPYRKGKTHE